MLVYDNKKSERILIFSTENNLKLLKENKDWYSDGTFKAVPRIFHQLYTIHIVNDNMTIPVVYGLLPDSSQAIYEEFFSALLELEPLLNPITILTDFEKAALNAIKNVFPEARQRGCFFHYCQVIYRNIQRDSDLYKKYRQDPDFALYMRNFMAFRAIFAELGLVTGPLIISYVRAMS